MGLIFSGIMIRTWAAGHLAKNERLVTSGPYRFVKNPLYIGTSKIVVGVCLIAQGPLTRPGFQELFPMIVTAIFFVFFLAYYVPYKMKKEYKRLERLFPEEWKAYDAGVPDYIPNFKGYDSAGKWDFSAYFNNSEHWTLASIVILVILLHFNEYVTRIFT
ncbi:MAG: hypothetical protein HY606_12395 [Planctomycetes bacterium]|nr:hypothetical protein [Planctomycetota bacterium]